MLKLAPHWPDRTGCSRATSRRVGGRQGAAIPPLGEMQRNDQTVFRPSSNSHEPSGAEYPDGLLGNQARREAGGLTSLALSRNAQLGHRPEVENLVQLFPLE